MLTTTTLETHINCEESSTTDNRVMGDTSMSFSDEVVDAIFSFAAMEQIECCDHPNDNESLDDSFVSAREKELATLFPTPSIFPKDSILDTTNSESEDRTEGIETYETFYQIESGSKEDMFTDSASGHSTPKNLLNVPEGEREIERTQQIPEILETSIISRKIDLDCITPCIMNGISTPDTSIIIVIDTDDPSEKNWESTISQKAKKSNFYFFSQQ